MGPFAKTASGYDAIVVFVDRFSKMVHAVPCTMEHGARDFARLFFRHVFRLHGMPTSIISDRDPRWTSHFWEALFSMLGTRLKMSTAFHPQTDGQSESTNRIVQQVLRVLVNERNIDWDECLPAAEFAINNAVHTSTQMTPFEVCQGRKPLTPMALTHKTTESAVPAAAHWVQRQAEVLELVRKNLEVAQQLQKQKADRHRSDVTFEAGQMVKLLASALDQRVHADALGKKLSPKFRGPFLIERMVGPNAAVLELPGHIHKRKHRTFNVEKLSHWVESAKFPRTAVATPTPAPMVQGEQGYFPEAFLLRQRRKGPTGHMRWEIFVKWRGYSEDENSWEPEWRLRADLKNDFDLLLSQMENSSTISDEEDNED